MLRLVCVGRVQKAMGNYCFTPFIAFLLFTTAFTIWFVPETRGRSPAEIKGYFQGRGYNAVASDDTGETASLSVQYSALGRDGAGPV